VPLAAQELQFSKTITLALTEHKPEGGDEIVGQLNVA